MTTLLPHAGPGPHAEEYNRLVDDFNALPEDQKTGPAFAPRTVQQVCIVGRAIALMGQIVVDRASPPPPLHGPL